MNPIIPRDVVSPRPGSRHDSQPPTRPTDAKFPELLQEVVDTVHNTERGIWSTEFLAKDNPTSLGGKVPKLIKKKLNLGTNKKPKPKNLALAVSMDKPWHLGEFLLEELLRRGVKYKIDKPGTVQFCDADSSYMQVMQDLNTSTSKALDQVFDIKYYWKELRPEDYLGVPGEIFNVDGYPAPQHYRYGAGHGAAAGATYKVIARNLDLSPKMDEHVMHACWCFAQGRSFLGVHLHEDNAEGFRVGLKF
jgi:hypothetical protein